MNHLNIIVGAGVDNTIAYSSSSLTTPEDWTGLGTTLFSLSGNDIAFNGNMYVVVGEGSTHTLAYSFNGINWVGLNKVLFSVRGNGICTNNNDLWVATGSSVNKIGYSFLMLFYIRGDNNGNTIFSENFISP